MPSVIIKSKHRALLRAAQSKNLEEITNIDLHPNTRYHDYFISTTFIVLDKDKAKVIKSVDNLFVEGDIIPIQDLFSKLSDVEQSTPATKHPVDVHISF